VRETEDRMIFLLRGFGCSQAEVAEVLGVSQRAVSYRLQSFQELLEGDRWLTKMVEWVVPIIMDDGLRQYILNCVRSRRLLPQAKFNHCK